MKIFIHEGTHWDREWYRTYQGFRFRLVDMIDDLIRNFEEDENFGVFHLDGQVVPLFDYLEIRPENREKLTKLIKDGKIIIGPWYDMPDEFLISGESMIANLRRGMKTAREEFGTEPCKNAYICDIFGHSAQTPQIFSGMGLKHTVLGRGSNEHSFAKHFRWQSPDGSFVTAYRLDEYGGYNDFSKFIWSVPENATDEELDRLTREFIDKAVEKTNIPILTLFEAGDHSHTCNLKPYIDSIKRVYPDAEVYWTSIEEMNKAEDEYTEKLPVHIGEIDETTCKGDIEEIMRQPGPFSYLIPNTASSRYPLKKYNDINQTAVEKKVRPLYGFHLTDKSRGFLNCLERYMLLNHPHDSICGCSIDEVHDDMLYRFNQTKYICDELIENFKCEKLSASKEGDGKILRLYNWLPYNVSRTLSVKIGFEPDYPRYYDGFGYQYIAAFKIFDADGNEIPYGITDITRPDGADYDLYTVTFKADMIPMGITEYSVKTADKPTRYPEKLIHSPKHAENEFIAVKFRNDGTFDLYDKQTGEIYKNLLTMVDEGEIGDGWFHSSPVPDSKVTVTSATVETTENNCERITFKVTQSLVLPKCIDRSHGFHRSSETDVLKVVHKVSLSKTDRYLDIHTEIENNIRDHRLKVVLPSGTEGETYFASEAFGLAERNRDDNLSSADWKEFEAAEKQTEGIVFVKNDKRGLAFVSDYGIKECAVRRDGRIEMTLIRAFAQTVSKSAICENCELLEKLEYRYQIVPMSKNDGYAYLRRIADIHSCEPLTAVVSGEKAEKSASLLSLEHPSLIYSTADLLESGKTEIRFFNASDSRDTATVLLPETTVCARLTELDGRVIKELKVSSGRVKLKLSPWKIYTLEIE